MERSNNSSLVFRNGITAYELLGEIGIGAYGKVFKARHRVSKEMYALKKVEYFKVDKKVPISVIREFKALSALQHKNIVHMAEVRITCGGSFANFVLEYCEYELAKLLARQSLRFHLAEIKAILKQLFEGLSYLHEQNFIHRDIKPANVLINNAGELKIADFGLARQFPPPADERTIYSPRVVTLWYRAPELLLGQKDYGTSVDMWAAGCLAAEMWTRTPILQGKGEPDQLNQIIRLCGPITMDTFPGVAKIALFRKLRLPRRKRRLQETLRSTVTDRHGLDLIDKLLTIDTETRADAKTALDHEFFQEEPLDCDLREMLAHFERKRESRMR